jgi:hypothetical protein
VTVTAVDRLWNILFTCCPCVFRGAAAGITPRRIHTGTPIKTEVRRVLAFINVIITVPATPTFPADARKTFWGCKASLCVTIYARGTEAVV